MATVNVSGNSTTHLLTRLAEMTKLSLADIKEKVDELASKIDAPEDLLPTYGFSRDSACPHIEVGNSGSLHYVVVERGEILERRTTKILDDLLYWIFAMVTFEMASKYELENRIEDKDCRRIMFDKQEELLGILNEQWQKREHEEHKRILEKYPFDDLAGLRATYSGELREKGYSETEINRLAYEKFPAN